MYKVVIVDDEAVARRILEKYIEDLYPDFDVVATFCNGKDSIEYLRKNLVDVMFVDVRIPGISGIEVVKYIYENVPSVKVVVVSAYLEFEYVQQAMKYGAIAYLTKVVKIEDFKETIDKIRKSIEFDNVISNRDKENMYKRFLKALYNGLFSNEKEIEAAWKEIGGVIPYNEVVFETVKFKTSDFENLTTDKYGTPEEVLESLFMNFVRMISSEAYVVFFGMRDDDFSFVIMHNQTHHSNIIDKLLRGFRDLLGIKIQLSFKKVISLCEFMENKDELYSEIGDKNTDLFISADEANDNEAIIHKAEVYMKRFYNLELTREDVAKQVHLSYKQLDRIFKNAIGKTVYEYLTGIRMIEATKKIKNGDSIENVYLDVGYRDIRSFRRAFMKYYNCTVSEYKKRLCGVSDEK